MIGNADQSGWQSVGGGGAAGRTFIPRYVPNYLGFSGGVADPTQWLAKG